MREVTLTDMLTARENRVRQQTEIIRKHRCSLICFTMNIAGPIKTSPLIERAFKYGLEQLLRCLPKEQILYQSATILPTGCEAMFAVDSNPQALKSIGIHIEQATPIGRLFDIDVLDENGNKLSREIERGCIVCGANGRACASRRLHDVPTLQKATQRIISEHFAMIDSEKTASVAVNALLKEVNTTPKPGLVDRRNNGSHADMTIETFYKGANSLHSYFAECFTIGRETASHAPESVFALLRDAGIRAEKTMLQATDGVNTHKGAIYIFGALCGAIGRLWTAQTPFAGIEKTLSECAQLVRQSTQQDFAQAGNESFGLYLYRAHGIKGVRGELVAGLPSVIEGSLPALTAALQAGLSYNDSGCIALLHLIQSTDDTTLYRRGGIEGVAYAKNTVNQLLSQQPYPTTEQIEALDDEFIHHNLTVGGCADLLATTYFLYDLKTDHKEADA